MLGVQNPSTQTPRPLSASVRFTDIIWKKKTNIQVTQMMQTLFLLFTDVATLPVLIAAKLTSIKVNLSCV